MNDCSQIATDLGSRLLQDKCLEDWYLGPSWLVCPPVSPLPLPCAVWDLQAAFAWFQRQVVPGRSNQSEALAEDLKAGDKQSSLVLYP